MFHFGLLTTPHMDMKNKLINSSGVSVSDNLVPLNPLTAQYIDMNNGVRLRLRLRLRLRVRVRVRVQAQAQAQAQARVRVRVRFRDRVQGQGHGTLSGVSVSDSKATVCC